jgi:hypothetical protein
LGTISLYTIFNANFIASLPPVGYKTVAPKLLFFNQLNPPKGPLRPSTPINFNLFQTFYFSYFPGIICDNIIE